MLHTKLGNKKIILASKSPRRQQLLEGLDIPFDIRVKDTDEIVPDGMDNREVAQYLAQLKADAFDVTELGSEEILITADTVVILDGKILGKPSDYQEAFAMLKGLSGNTHKVVTGVCLKQGKRFKSFKSETKVQFRSLSDQEISYYLEKYKPYDKAGSYGIQEWIGYIGIERIEGSYFNVMGLPVQKLYDELNGFIEE
jgi:septum formation protein